MARRKSVALEPKYLVDQHWKVSKRVVKLQGRIAARTHVVGTLEVTKRTGAKPVRKAVTTLAPSEESELLKLIRNSRIEIAEAAETKKIASEGKYDYLKSEIGMNIVLPRGTIRELRFAANLVPGHRVKVIDGFPKDKIDQRSIVGGKITLGIDKAFQFIPNPVAKGLTQLLNVDLDPWEFRLGNVKSVKVDFSGGLTSFVEWYFRRNGIRNNLRVALVIRKLKGVKSIQAKVTAFWSYKDHPFRKGGIRSDEKVIEILSE